MAHPIKSGKQAAWKAYRKTAAARPPHAELLARHEAQKRSARWSEGTIPNLSTWINEHRWEDDPGTLTAVHSGARRALAKSAHLAAELQVTGYRDRACDAPTFSLPEALRAITEALPIDWPRRVELVEKILALVPLRADAAEEGLLAIETELLTEAQRRLGAEDRSAIQAELSQALSRCRAPTDDARRALGRQILRNRLRLPILSLFATQLI
jgi:hypothetical protein